MTAAARTLWSRGLVAAMCVAIAGGPVPAAAWGVDGHEAIAMVADRALTTAARTRVYAILALEPGATLSSVSNWADQIKNRSTAQWHYVNLPRGSDCVYQPQRDCPGGQCVVEALNVQSRRLASAVGADQLEALKFIVHLVGDVHQPLHAGFADDRGGNTYQLQAFGRGTNLHALWDSGLTRNIAPDSQSLARVAGSQLAPQLALGFAPEQWAGESCRISSRPDFYPGRRLDDSYTRTFEPIVQARLQLAGLRLANLLNRTFASPS